MGSGMYKLVREKDLSPLDEAPGAVDITDEGDSGGGMAPSLGESLRRPFVEQRQRRAAAAAEAALDASSNAEQLTVDMRTNCCVRRRRRWRRQRRPSSLL